jgi:hypothetical protein
MKQELSAPLQITGVRTSKGMAIVLLGSRSQPAGHILLQRQRGHWMINALIGAPLP